MDLVALKKLGDLCGGYISIERIDNYYLISIYKNIQ